MFFYPIPYILLLSSVVSIAVGQMAFASYFLLLLLAYESIRKRTIE
jgi:hypothetical protein